MCTNCVGTADFLVANAALVAGAAHAALRASEPAPLREARSVLRDAHTVAFLRGLDLDPAAVLGAAVVEVADDEAVLVRARALVAERAQARSGRARSRLGAIFSQRRLALQ